MLLLKDLRAMRVSPVGNPAMPIKLPFGPKWLQNINLAPKIPNILWSVPGVEKMATVLMQKTIKKSGVASIED